MEDDLRSENKAVKLTYYPGCTLFTKARNLDDCSRKAAKRVLLLFAVVVHDINAAVGNSSARIAFSNFD